MLILDIASDSATINANITFGGGVTIVTSGTTTISNGATVTADSNTDGTGALAISGDDDNSGGGNVNATDGTFLLGSEITLTGHTVSTFRLSANTGDIQIAATHDANLQHFSSTPTNFIVTADRNINIPSGTHFNRILEAGQ